MKIIQINKVCTVEPVESIHSPSFVRLAYASNKHGSLTIIRFLLVPSVRDLCILRVVRPGAILRNTSTRRCRVGGGTRIPLWC